MKPIKQPETKITLVVPSVEQSQPPKKPKIDSTILKAIALIINTLIILLNPEATIAIALIKLLFILLEWLNNNKA